MRFDRSALSWLRKASRYRTPHASSTIVSRFTARMRRARLNCPNHWIRRLFIQELVPYAIECLDGVELGIHRAKLAAHALDVTVDGAVVDIDVVVVRDIQELVAGLHDSGT